jgi:hypothetical protein
VRPMGCQCPSDNDNYEMLSLDEACLDVTENKTGLPTAAQVARTIREQIRTELPLPVGRLPGVGKVTEEKPKGFDVQTIADLRGLGLPLFEIRFGRYGVRLYESKVVPDCVSLPSLTVWQLLGRRTGYSAKSFLLLLQNIRASSDSRISSLPCSQNCCAATRASFQTSNVFAVACGRIKCRGGTWPSAVGAYNMET